MLTVLSLLFVLLACACGTSPSGPGIWADTLEISCWLDYLDLHVEWTRHPGVYTLQRRSLPDGAYDLLYAGTDTSYVDSTLVAFVVYRFRVGAFDPDQVLLASDSLDVQRCF